MTFPRRAIGASVAIAALLSATLAVIYLLVACQSLPGFMGPVAGDTHPRTKLGVALLVFAVLLAGISGLAWRDGRRR